MDDSKERCPVHNVFHNQGPKCHIEATLAQPVAREKIVPLKFNGHIVGEAKVDVLGYVSMTFDHTPNGQLIENWIKETVAGHVSLDIHSD